MQQFGVVQEVFVLSQAVFKHTEAEVQLVHEGSPELHSFLHQILVQRALADSLQRRPDNLHEAVRVVMYGLEECMERIEYGPTVPPG